MFILVSKSDSRTIQSISNTLQTKIADLVQIAPAQFESHSRIAIENNINAKYSNRVIQKIGLCICMYDLLWASEGLIGHGSGLVNVNGTLLTESMHF
jgi:DNA-directed RNA polymerase subunit E'/Rpb7